LLGWGAGKKEARRIAELVVILGHGLDEVKEEKKQERLRSRLLPREGEHA
jgi:hypothetical protein